MVHFPFPLLFLTLLISPSLQSPIAIWPKPCIFSWPDPQAIFLSPNLTITVFPNQHKYRAIVSSAEFYYLDHGHGGWVGNNSVYNQPPGTDQGTGGSWRGSFKTWQIIYNYDITYGLTNEEAKLVLGGELALWTEQADQTVLDARNWPRGSAFAETMWSGNKDDMGNKRFAEATDRLNEWRYRLVTNGIGAKPIQPLWCVRNPGMCNNVYAD